MVYKTRTRFLYTGVYEKYKLTGLENKVLICLSSGNVTTYEEMSKYLYGVYNKSTYNSVAAIVLKLRVKTERQLRIKTISCVGYRLESEIYFE